MKFLQKILFVAMISVFVGNVNAVLDFDNIAPGATIPYCFQPHNYVPAHPVAANLPTVNCVYFNVIPAPGAAAHPIPAVQAATAPKPYVANEHNIYFPADGSQPTTAEAARYSCANVNDNRVTEWYMKMFGVIPFQNGRVPGINDYIKAGWTNVPAATKIVNINTTLAGIDALL